MERSWVRYSTKLLNWTTIQLDGPESQVKIVQSSAVKCIWPLRFDVQLLGGLGKYVGRALKQISHALEKGM